MANSAANQTAVRAFIDIYTRGEPHLQAPKNGIHEQAQTDNPLYRTAVVERMADTEPAGPIQQASAQTPASAGTPNAFSATPAKVSAPPTTVVTAQPVPVQTGPLPPTIIPVPAPPSVSPPPTLQPQPQPPAPPVTQPPSSAVPVAPKPAPARPPTPAPLRQIQVEPRNGTYQQRTEVLPNGEQVLVLTGGVILLVRSPGANIDVVDIEADNVVIWSHGSFEQLLHNMRGPQGQRRASWRSISRATWSCARNRGPIAGSSMPTRCITT